MVQMITETDPVAVRNKIAEWIRYKGLDSGIINYQHVCNELANELNYIPCVGNTKGQLTLNTSIPVSISLWQLQQAHVQRQEEWCPDQKPDLSFRGNELAGETGETVEALMLHIAEISKQAGIISNVVKKLERERHQWRGSRTTKEALASELADMIHCTVLVAITAGIDIEPAVHDKFNETSHKQGLTTFL